MKKDGFRVPRTVQGTTTLYSANRNQIEMWYGNLPQLFRTMAFGLLYATDRKKAAGWHSIRPSELLDIIEVAKVTRGDGVEVFHGRHYQAAFEAMLHLYNASMPVRITTWEKAGRKYDRKYHFRQTRFIQGIGLVYRDEGGNPVDLDHPSQTSNRVDVSNRYGAIMGRNSDLPVWAMVARDEDGNVRMDDQGKPIPRPPDYLEWQWATEIVNDLDSSEGGPPKQIGSGWVKYAPEYFNIMKQLRERNAKYAMRLFDLVVGDMFAKPTSNPTQIRKAAKLIFSVLGRPEPGTVNRAGLAKKDGRWAENVRTVADAVRHLKDVGVLMPESDEDPREDPNPDRSKAPYYLWRRAEKWSQCGTMEVLQRVDDGGQGQPGPVTPAQRPTGHEIREARMAAGLNVRQFKERFGRSTWFWSHVENQTPNESTGQPPIMADALRDQVEQFVMEWLPEYVPEGRHSGQKELFEGEE